MSYLNSVESAIKYIEGQLSEESLSIPQVCQQIGVSKWYFQRIFKAVTGDSLGEYIRKRQLSLSANELLKTNRPIIELAMSSGFESQEAYSRAFKKHFEVTPSQFRKNQNPKMFMHKFELNKEFLKHLEERLIVQPKIENIKNIKLVGFKKSFRGVFDKNPNNHEVIPKLWGELMNRCGEIQNRVSGPAFGVVLCGEEDGLEKLEYLAAMEVSDYDNVPEGMDKMNFPPGKMAKFTHKGSPQGIEKTIKYIFGTWLPQSGDKLREGLELEIYPENYNPNDPNSSFEYCLALQ